jgi:hypothetical protein
MKSKSYYKILHKRKNSEYKVRTYDQCINNYIIKLCSEDYLKLKFQLDCLGYSVIFIALICING